MKTLSTLVLAGAIAAAFATSALAQSSPTPTPPPSFKGPLPQSGYGVDIWSYMAVKRMDNEVHRIVDKESWNRARRAAAAINDGKCGEAAVIAAQANDVNLMTGIKRACKFS